MAFKIVLGGQNERSSAFLVLPFRTVFPNGIAQWPKRPMNVPLKMMNRSAKKSGIAKVRVFLFEINTQRIPWPRTDLLYHCRTGDLCVLQGPAFCGFALFSFRNECMHLHLPLGALPAPNPVLGLIFLTAKPHFLHPR